ISRPVAGEILPVELNTILVARILERDLIITIVGRGVTQDDRLDVISACKRVLQGNGSAIRTASHREFVRTRPLPKSVDVSGPLRVRIGLDALAQTTPTSVKYDNPKPIGESPKSGLRLRQRTDASATVVSNEHGTTLGPV